MGARERGGRMVAKPVDSIDGKTATGFCSGRSEDVCNRLHGRISQLQSPSVHA